MAQLSPSLLYSIIVLGVGEKMKYSIFTITLHFVLFQVEPVNCCLIPTMGKCTKQEDILVTVLSTPVGWDTRSLGQRRGFARLQDCGLVRNHTARKKVGKDKVKMIGYIEIEIVSY